MSRYQAIALDMDGTLLNRDHKISSATRAALAQARAHGIKVLLVTGRHFMTARPFHHELALDTPIICSNGAYLYDPVQERILAGDPLAVAPLTTLLEEVLAATTTRLRIMSRGRYEMRRKIEPVNQRAQAAPTRAAAVSRPASTLPRSSQLGCAKPRPRSRSSWRPWV